jgi:predicted ATPase
MTASPTTSLGLEAELLERDAALAGLAEALETVRATSQGRLVLLPGEAGLGKTALLRRFRDRLDESQRVLSGGCDPLFTPRPLGPLLAIAEEIGGELADVVARGAIPHEVVAVLVRVLRSPTVFVLEDVHWADEATLDVLRLLVRRIESVPVLIVASYRDDELDRRHPLRVMLGELATNIAVTRLRIDPLSPSAVEQLAEPHGVDADELYRKTLGNPFFVAEVLSATGAGIPDTVRDAVLARAAPLSPAARQLLEAIAVVPVRVELPLLAAVAGDGIGAFEECLRSGVLAADPSGVSYRHELARLAFEEAIPPNRTCWAGSPARRERQPISRASHTTRRQPEMQMPSAATRRQPPSGRPRSGHIARLQPSTHAHFGSASSSPTRNVRSSSSAAPTRVT